MTKKELKEKLMDVYNDVVFADEYGNDHNSRKETRQNFDNIIDNLMKILEE